MAAPRRTKGKGIKGKRPDGQGPAFFYGRINRGSGRKNQVRDGVGCRRYGLHRDILLIGRHQHPHVRARFRRPDTIRIGRTVEILPLGIASDRRIRSWGAPTGDGNNEDNPDTRAGGLPPGFGTEPSRSSSRRNRRCGTPALHGRGRGPPCGPCSRSTFRRRVPVVSIVFPFCTSCTVLPFSGDTCVWENHGLTGE